MSWEEDTRPTRSRVFVWGIMLGTFAGVILDKLFGTCG